MISFLSESKLGLELYIITNNSVVAHAHWTWGELLEVSKKDVNLLSMLAETCGKRLTQKRVGLGSSFSEVRRK